MTTQIQHSAGAAQPVRQVSGVEDWSARTISVDGSNSFDDLGYGLHPDVQAVVGINTSGATLYYTPNGGTAGTGNLAIPDGQSFRIEGNRRKLAKARFYLASAGNV